MRKFLVVVDNTPECMNALRFAARRAARTGGMVTMLFVIEPADFQHWMGVAEAMSRDRRDEAEARLTALADEVHVLAGIMPEFAIREGRPADEVLAFIAEDEDVGVLVLGAADADDPGPLVSALVGKRSGRMPVPVTVVPGALSLERIDAIC
jgi:nucleotide-binding universal stress UspA family protein